MRTFSLFALLAAILLPMATIAQTTFNKSITSTGSLSSTAYGKDLVLAPDGYYLMASGHIDSLTGGPTLMKMDLAGNILRQEKLTISPQVAAAALDPDEMQWTSEGQLLIAEAWQRLIKVDTLGAVLWGREVDGVTTNDYRIEAMAQTPDGKIALGMHLPSNLAEPRLMVCDSNGRTLFYMIYNVGTTMGQFNDLDATPDGGFLATGENGVLMKLDVFGEPVWGQAIDYPGFTEFHSTLIETNGSSTTIGAGGSFSNGLGHIALVRMDPNGSLLWARAYETATDITGFDLQRTPDGGYILAGANDNNDILLIKTDNVGAPIWNRFGPSDGMQEIKRLQQTDDGGFAALGWGLDGSAIEGRFIKADSNGFSNCLDQTLPINYVQGAAGFIFSLNTAFTTLGDTMSPVAIDSSSLDLLADVNCLFTHLDPALAMKGGFSLYPNPVRETFFIEGAWQDDQMTHYSLFDLQGRLLWEKEMEGMEHEIAHDAPLPGVYLLRAKHGDRVVTRPLLVH